MKRKKMVGIFSRFYVSKSTGHHRRTQSAIDERRPLPPNPEVAATTIAAAAAAHGIEVAIEFKPVEHPTEPFDHDQPVKCPLPEPSILNDGRVWKERISASSQKKITSSSVDSEIIGTRSRSSNRLILPSLSAPEHNIINLLEECNTSGM
ncbi:hypothetical protein C5167_032711 [Papaver somniferum]|uniref:Uncharacterized protein n=1 Tax=Papaver somniferum TaxID=3469 RepID=A0A4Y7K9K5_PAPSO|nr:uncharacterized protein LOC113297624 [Papaver somniferum]RZC69567.1 hypothetical protein C5167_032711 [Papaver somniferum]